ncbi:hypothetical protein LTR84_010877 [Exophiala bonariae]|uniref:Methyltransferase domain-containing protein n=1 Tax=Exophiala bonariae TaxID=1690606 RepID=A0AAV9NI39_9EURO|nr:hypothetical protein LTR84_010877 [Exophiala bonariae]
MKMANQYDEIGLAYESIKRFPAAVLERRTFQSVITPLLSSRKDVKILDLACGTGYYTRLLAEWGGNSISDILGIDLSPVMVEAARAASSPATSASQYPDAEGKAPNDDKITFQVGDCTQPLNLSSGPFTIATGAWLLNYASSAAAMTGMFRNIAQNLCDDGVFIGITPYPAPDLDAFAESFSPSNTNTTATSTSTSINDDQAKYGVTVQYTRRLASGEGYATKITAHTTPVEIAFENFHLSREVYELCARDGGLRGDMRWVDPVLPATDEESLSVYGHGIDLAWWDSYRARMHCAVLVVRKS